MKNFQANLIFINTAFNHFPIEENDQYNVPHKVQNYIFSKVISTPLKNPKLICFSEDMAKILNLDLELFKNQNFIDCLVGNQKFEGSLQISNNYCGFQFGSFAGQLGDGRAISLGDIKNDKNEIWEIQLKGAGKTPYSRSADGRAVLRSSIREYMASEAMFYLNIPTTRALSIIVSDDLVKRDLLYNGNVILEKCAVVSRIAQSFLRFGSFEITLPQKPNFEGGNCKQNGEKFSKVLIDYIQKYHYQDMNILDIYKEIVKRSAKLVSEWQCVGFVHGVLNTDNMSILGLTIDYGPYGFMEYFDKNFIPNHSDERGRYSYQNQPEIFKWNLIKLSEALFYTNQNQLMKEYTDKEFMNLFNNFYYEKMANKLGFQYFNQESKQIIDLLINTMQQSSSDFTNTFLILQDLNQDNLEIIIYKLLLICAPNEICQNKQTQINRQQINQLLMVYQQSPEKLFYFGITKEFLDEQLQILNEKEKNENITQDIRDQQNYKYWQNFLKIYLNQIQNVNKELMIKNNPQIILRNHMLQTIIEKSEQGDYSNLEELFQEIKTPFQIKDEKYKQIKPKWSYDLCVSCSS